MGLIFVRPEHDKVALKPLEITDVVFDKYLDMINNDNDASYVMNALPELKNADGMTNFPQSSCLSKKASKT